jgi:hypothetical protein
MSLINDALKRARDAERQKGAAPPKVPLQPVDYAGRRPPASQWLVLVLILLALGFSVLSFLKWSGEKPPTAQAPLRTNAPVKAPVVSLPTAPTNAAAPRPQPRHPVVQVNTNVLARTEGRPSNAATSAQSPSPEPRSASGADPAEAAPTPSAGTSSPTNTAAAVAAPALTNASGTATNAASADPDRPPELRLQSIIYRLRNPSAVINGAMLQVGDSIAGGRVTEIQRHAVTVRWKETNLVLELPRL